MKLSLRVDPIFGTPFAALYFGVDEGTQLGNKIIFEDTLSGGLTVRKAVTGSGKTYTLSKLPAMPGQRSLRVPKQYLGDLPYGNSLRTQPITVFESGSDFITFDPVAIDPTGITADSPRGSRPRDHAKRPGPGPRPLATVGELTGGCVASGGIVEVKGRPLPEIVGSGGNASAVKAAEDGFPGPVRAPESVVSLRALSVISKLMHEYFNESTGRYSTGWGDKRISDSSGFSLATVVQVREALFGRMGDPELDRIEGEMKRLLEAVKKLDLEFGAYKVRIHA